MESSGFFEICREPADISYSEFVEKYFNTEQPVIIEGIGSQWPAKSRWNAEHLHNKLSKEPSASAAKHWYWMNRGALDDDYTTPSIVDQCIDSDDVFKRTQSIRVWQHSKNNVSHWHYDGGFVNVFNAQVKGDKEWFLVSPDTPLDCYPYTNFAILDNKSDQQTFRKKVHTQFVLKEGDMVYIPHLWFHKVVSLSEDNISINWIFTKKKTSIVSKTFTRELDRYRLLEYFGKHRLSWVRTPFNRLNAKLPDYLKVVWRYSEMIQSPYPDKPIHLITRMLKEGLMSLKMLAYVHKIKPYIKSLTTVKKLNKG